MMNWKVTHITVALSYTSMRWEREVEGSTQRLTVMVWNTDEMSLIAEETWDGVHNYRQIVGHKRDYICTSDEITHFFKKVMMKGDAK